MDLIFALLLFVSGQVIDSGATANGVLLSDGHTVPGDYNPPPPPPPVQKNGVLLSD